MKASENDKRLRGFLYVYSISKHKGESAIELIIHYPETPEQQALFDARVAKFHAEYVAHYIEKLDCPTQQKLQLLDAIAQTILGRCEGKTQR